MSRLIADRECAIAQIQTSQYAGVGGFDITIGTDDPPIIVTWRQPLDAPAVDPRKVYRVTIEELEPHEVSEIPDAVPDRTPIDESTAGQRTEGFPA